MRAFAGGLKAGGIATVVVCGIYLLLKKIFGYDLSVLIGLAFGVLAPVVVTAAAIAGAVIGAKAQKNEIPSQNKGVGYRILVNGLTALGVTVIVGFLCAIVERAQDPQNDMAGLGGGGIVILSPVIGIFVAAVTGIVLEVKRRKNQ